jgi:tetratricopeptide (TPR) repeat protein
MEKALADYNELIRLYPDDADAYKLRGDLNLSQGDLAKALSDYTAAIKCDPGSNSSAYLARANAYEKLGKTDLSKNDRAKAEHLRVPD